MIRGDTKISSEMAEEPRSGSHWIRVTILALVPILIVAGGGTYLLTRHTKPDRRQAEATAALAAYLAAWSKGDYAGMAAHSDAPATAIQAVAAPIKRNLAVTDSRYAPGVLTRDQSGDRGTAPYSARLTLTDRKSVV